MKQAGYSLVEVLVAAVVVGIGMTAAAVLIGSLSVQEEINAASLRAANLQEQAVMLFRLKVQSNDLRAILPEVCTNTTTTPPEDQFSIQTTSTTLVTSGVFEYDTWTMTVIYAMPTMGNGSVTRITNSSKILSMH